jgi:hypothetical protein
MSARSKYRDTDATSPIARDARAANKNISDIRNASSPTRVLAPSLLVNAALVLSRTDRWAPSDAWHRAASHSASRRASWHPSWSAPACTGKTSTVAAMRSLSTAAWSSTPNSASHRATARSSPATSAVPANAAVAPARLATERTCGSTSSVRRRSDVSSSIRCDPAAARTPRNATPEGDEWRCVNGQHSSR